MAEKPEGCRCGKKAGTGYSRVRWAASAVVIYKIVKELIGL